MKHLCQVPQHKQRIAIKQSMATIKNKMVKCKGTQEYEKWKEILLMYEVAYNKFKLKNDFHTSKGFR